MNKKEEGKPNVSSVTPEIEAAKASEKKPLTQEQVRRLQKEAAVELASYKRRLRESVELKELQVKELRLNIEYYHVRIEHDEVSKKMDEYEAKMRAEVQKVREEAEKKKKAEKSLSVKPTIEEAVQLGR